MTDHIYMNLDVVNDGETDQQPLIFSETRTMPFLGNASDYFASVIRFSIITSNSLPVFIPAIDTSQADVNITAYQISLRLSAAKTGGGYVIFERSLPITYYPSDMTQPPPTEVSQASNALQYYWVMNISDWVVMINYTFENLTRQLIEDIAASTEVADRGFKFEPPFVSFDISTGLFTISRDVVLDTSTHTILIYFNTRLYNILPFPAVRNFLGLGVNKYFINIPRNGRSNTSTLYINNVKTEYETLSTEFSPLCLLNPVKAISFTTNTLPIQPTLTQPPKVYKTVRSLANSGLPDITNIIADFQIPVNASNTYNGELIYQPAAEYRLLNMNASVNLNKIDLNCFWEDKYGGQHQIYLQPSCTASLKLLFRHKRFNLSYNY